MERINLLFKKFLNFFYCFLIVGVTSSISKTRRIDNSIAVISPDIFNVVNRYFVSNWKHLVAGIFDDNKISEAIFDFNPC